MNRNADEVSQTPRTVELSGTPRDIGRAHGQHLSDQIRAQIAVYNAMFQQTSKMDWAAVRNVARDYKDTLERLTPEILDEIIGIAEGAGLDVLDIVALNARSEIALGLFSDGCTALGWKTSEREVFLGQNWDWTARVKENLVLMSIEQPGKPKIYMVTEAGVVGKIGFNSSSVGTCLNAIRARPTDSKKVPIHIALRLCLEATSVQGAVAKLNSLGGVASSQHILIADSSGPLGLELSPVGNAFLHPSDTGVITHTNHFLSNRFVEEPPWLTDSPVRLERANELVKSLADAKQSVDGELLRCRIFSDTFNAPGSICRQENSSRPIETRSMTLFCIVMRFEIGKNPTAELVWGRPGSEGAGLTQKVPW